jgi:GT2 family glycosyltransferase
MRCSIIVPTYNRAPLLALSLGALGRLDYDGEYEVIVVDDGSTDDTPRLLRERFPHVRSVRLESNRGEWPARTRGIAEASGDLFVFTDDDCLVGRDWLRRHAAHHDVPGVGAAGGPVVPRSPTFFDKFHVAHTCEVFRVAERVEGLTAWESLITANLSVPRAVIDRVGGFDERFKLGADPDLVRRVSRAGYAFVRDPALPVEHLKSYGLASLLRDRFRKASGSIGTDVKEGTVRLRRFVPLPNPKGVAQTWHRFRDLYGGSAATVVPVGALAVVVRWTEVAGRIFYYWTHARRQDWARERS